MKSILSYLIVLISAFGYMLLFDAKAGAMMFVFLIVTSLISVFFTLRTRKKISFSVETENDILKKGKGTSITVNVNKDTFIPVPLITFLFNISPRFKKPEFEQYKFSMSEKKSMNINIDIIPEICGCAYVDIDKIYISDYLGIFKFKIINNIPVRKKLFIRPDIAKLEENGDLFKSIYNTIPDNDDESSESSSSSSGFPGYEYREYVPGDSPKKINWKLSSKRNRLFVRLDEAASVSLPKIILDNSLYIKSDDQRADMMMEEKIIECSLGVLMTCIRHGVECTYSYTDEGILKTETVSSTDDAEIIADKLSRINYDHDIQNYLTSQKSKATDINIVFTMNITQKIASMADTAVLNGDLVKIIVPERSLNNNYYCSADIWMIGDNSNISRVV